VAARKARSLLDCGARVRLVSPELCPELRTLADQGRLEALRRVYVTGDLAGAWLVFAATSDPEAQRSIAAEAAERSIPCNLADGPGQSSFHVPAVLRRGELTVAVATNGRSPALAALLKQELAERYGVEYAVLVALLGELRDQVLARKGLGEAVPDESLVRRLLHPELIDWIRQGREDLVAGHCRAVLGFAPVLDLAALKQHEGPPREVLCPLEGEPGETRFSGGDLHLKGAA